MGMTEQWLDALCKHCTQHLVHIHTTALCELTFTASIPNTLEDVFRRTGSWDAGVEALLLLQEKVGPMLTDGGTYCVYMYMPTQIQHTNHMHYTGASTGR